MSESILSVVKVINKDEEYYIGSGGTNQRELQKAQIFGWSRNAKKNLARYENHPEHYKVLPIKIELV